MFLPARLSYGQSTARTLSTCTPEVEHANPVAGLEFVLGALGPDLDDCSGWLVRGDDGKLGSELAVPDLQVGVAEAGGVDLDKELRIGDLGDIYGCYLVRFVVLGVVMNIRTCSLSIEGCVHIDMHVPRIIVLLSSAQEPRPVPPSWISVLQFTDDYGLSSGEVIYRRQSSLTPATTQVMWIYQLQHFPGD